MWGDISITNAFLLGGTHFFLFKSSELACMSLAQSLLTGTILVEGKQQVLVRDISVGWQGAEDTEQDTHFKHRRYK